MASSYGRDSRDEWLKVAVLEGAVEVSQATAGEPQMKRLSAGQQLDTPIHEGRLHDVSTLPASESATWRSGRLAYVDTPLSEVLADANRYSKKHLVVADRRAGDLRVSVTFRTDQIDEMINGLRAVLPIDVDRSAVNEIVFTHKDVPH